MGTIAVVTATDQRYVFPMAVMMRTAAMSLVPGAALHFHVLTTGLGSVAGDKLDRVLRGTAATWQEIVVDTEPLAGLKVDGHVSLATYFRLLAPRYLPDVTRVLYLDTDLIVLHSLDELWAHQFGGAHVLAVPHASKRSGFFGAERGVPSYAALGIPGDTRTFNAGVMLLNLEKWRATDASGRILRYLRDYRDQVLWHDQDGLNAVLHSDWRPLPARWNVMTSHFADFTHWSESLLDEATFEAANRDPAIIHYTNWSKPWGADYQGPFREHWAAVSEPVRPYFDLD